jgi:hypothetical protein
MAISGVCPTAAATINAVELIHFVAVVTTSKTLGKLLPCSSLLALDYNNS